MLFEKALMKGHENAFVESLTVVSPQAKGSDTSDGMFILRGSFVVRIPMEYEPDHHLSVFRRFYGDVIDLDRTWVDANHDRVTHKLEAKKRYLIKIFQIADPKSHDDETQITSKEIIEFMEKEDALFVGAQGLVLAWELLNLGSKKWELGVTENIFSFDKKDKLFSDECGTWIPALSIMSRGLAFCQGEYDSKWTGIYTYIICFYPIEG